MRKISPIFCLLLCSCLAAGCKRSVPVPADLAGVYQAPSGACTMMLTLRAGMSYTYERRCGTASPAFSNSNGWHLGSSDGGTSVVLHDFKLGTGPAGSEVGVLWPLKVERPWFGLGQPRLCMDLDQSYCFTR